MEESQGIVIVELSLLTRQNNLETLDFQLTENVDTHSGQCKVQEKVPDECI